MNKFKKNFTMILIFIFIFFLFKYNYILNKSVIAAVNIWLNNVFPALFIMFILNDIIINANVLDSLNKIINPIFNKLFKTNGNSSQAFILTFFSGTPSSAFIIKEMLNNNSISLNDANKLIAFTYFSNPLFLYSILSLTFNKIITLKIIAIHYLTNLFIGFLMRKKISNKYEIVNRNNSSPKNIFLLIPSSITKSLNTLLMILGTITFYMIITNMIINIVPFNPTLTVIFKGILEITQSLNDLGALSNISIVKEIIAISIISFGGLSIHTQVLAIINDTKINYKYFLIGRILHVLISAFTYCCIYFITC